MVENLNLNLVTMTLVENLKMNFGHKTLRLIFSHDFKAKFGKKLELNFGRDSEFEVRSKILKLKSSNLIFLRHVQMCYNTNLFIFSFLMNGFSG